MSGRGTHMQCPFTEVNSIAILQIPVCALCPSIPRESNDALPAKLQEPGSSNVIGVHMGFECRYETQPQFRNQCTVTTHLFEHRIDQDCFAIVAEKIAIG